jgi:hypothetical protein
MTQKDRYPIRNWKQYNQSLVNRGSITFWFNDETITKWYSAERTKQPGHPDIYSDDTIRCGLIIKAVFHVALRQLQGLIMSLIKMLEVDLVCPHYSVFSRRAKDLNIPMRKFLKRGEHLNIIFDSTGVKVFGEGDTIDCRQAIHDRGGKQVIPPNRAARAQRKDPISCLLPRDVAINRINELGAEGRAQWKKEIGYHRRSLAETFMFRYKTIVGDRLSARRWQTQIAEVKIKLDVINRMTELGMPKSHKRAI